MKLELKHLAPYLPYKLKIGEVKNFEKEREMICGGFNSSETVDIEPCVRLQYKPILRPLSDLTKEENIDVWNYILNDDAYDLSTLCEHKGDISHQLMYQVFDALVKTHFDVFGLIEKGFAIDKNTLES